MDKGNGQRSMEGEKHRVVVTGVGAVCAAGRNVDEFYVSLRDGQGGIRSVQGLDMSTYTTSLGGEVSGFTGENYLVRRTPDLVKRCVALTLAAAGEAITRAKLDLRGIDPHRIGIVLGTLLAGVRSGEVFHETWLEQGLPKTSRRFVVFQLPHTPADALGASLGLKGPKSVVSTACASGSNAIGWGMDLIANAKADIMLVGGVDPFSRLCFAGFDSLRALAAGPCAPFSTRSGLTIGEGAAILILERLDVAEQRDAPILAELLGYGLSADAYHPTAPEPSGSGMIRAMAAALQAAGVGPEEIDYVNAHGTGTAENDETETRAIKGIFGPRAYRIPVSSTKSFTGHPMGAAGALEAVASVLAILRQFVPPTINFERPKPGCDLDYVPNRSRPHAVSLALSNSFGFGGANAALVLSRYPRPRATTRARQPRHRVVVTGIGVASCAGIGVKAFWNSACAGRCGLTDITSFDSSPYGYTIAGEVQMSELHTYIDPKHLRHLDPLGCYAVACARMALNDAELKTSKTNAERIGVMFATGTGPLDTVEAFNRDIVVAGPSQAKPFLFQNTVFNAAAGHVCQQLGLKGYSSTLVIGDASFPNAVAYAYELLKQGVMEAIVVISADLFCEPLLAGFSKLKLLASDVCRPFDAKRDGIILSSGAAAFILERLEHAHSRGSQIYGEITGYGMTSDAYRCGGCDPDGLDWARAINMTLNDGSLRPEEVDWIAAAACGLRAIDLAETRAIKKAFGAAAYEVPVSAIRSIVGYAGASAPALALAAGLRGMQESLIPPTVNLVNQDPDCDLNYVPNDRLQKAINTFLVNSFAWGGSYVTLACSRYLR